MLNVLRAQAARAEIACGMWVRNGQSLAYQSVLYAQGSHAAAFLDLDVALLQLLTTRLRDVDWLLFQIISR